MLFSVISCAYRCHLKPYAGKPENQTGPKGKQFGGKLMAVDKLHFRFCSLFSRCHSFKFKGGTEAHTVMSTATHGSWKSSMGSTRRCANRLPRKCYQLLRFCSGPDLRPSQKMYFFLRRLRGWTDTPSVEAWTRPGFSGNCCFIISLVPAIYFGSLVLLTICRFFLYLIDLRNNAKEKKLRVLLGIFNWPYCII